MHALPRSACYELLTIAAAQPVAQLRQWQSNSVHYSLSESGCSACLHAGIGVCLLYCISCNIILTLCFIRSVVTTAVGSVDEFRLAWSDVQAQERIATERAVGGAVSECVCRVYCSPRALPWMQGMPTQNFFRCPFHILSLFSTFVCIDLPSHIALLPVEGVQGGAVCLYESVWTWSVPPQQSDSETDSD